MGNTQNISSGKTWQGLFQAIKDRISAGCLKKSQKPTFQCLIEDGQQPEWLEAGGEVRLGDCWTLNIGEYPSEENESTLSTVLEMTVPDKYYLSAKACSGIIRRAEKRGRTLPAVMEEALRQQIQRKQYSQSTADRHCVDVPECAAYRLYDYGAYKEGIGTLRAKGGDYGGGSETVIVEKRLQFAEAYKHHGYRMSEIANTQTAGGNAKGVRGDTSFVIEKMNILKGKNENIEYAIRRQTPTECERLDGFPDGWTQQDTKGKVISDNARYMALGNSIAVPCAARVFRGIIAVEAEVAAVAERNND